MTTGHVPIKGKKRSMLQNSLRTARRLGTAAGATLAGLLLCTSLASASQIDNDNEDTHVDIWFDCGFACGSYFKGVPPGTSVSYPGTAGKVEACWSDGDVWWRETPRSDDGMKIDESLRASVGKHGEVGVTMDLAKGDQRTFDFTWTSKGGNSWTGSVDHLSYGRDGYCWEGTP